MKTMLIATAILVSTNVSAEGFAPWETRDVVRTPVVETPAMVERSGFAPWDKRAVTPDVSGREMAGGKGSGFRPWS